MKRILSVLCCATILLTVLAPAAALADDGSADNFREGRIYADDFADVPAGAWYADSVARAWSLGLVDGVDGSIFAPDGGVSTAQSTTMAARLHSIYHTGAADFAAGDPWYVPYVDYALENGILAEEFDDWGAEITRGQFARLLARALPADELPQINAIEDGAIPDTPPESPYYDDILLLYRAGVLTGCDAMGSARPDEPLRRSEAAALLVRMADPDARQEVQFEPGVTLYAPDGRSITVAVSEAEAYTAVGWYRVPVTTIYTQDGRSAVIAEGELEAYLAVGWSDTKYIPLPETLRAQNKTDSIPVICVETGGAEVLSRTDYVPCTVNVFNVPEEYALSGASGGIRVRGNSASYYGNVGMIRSHSVPYRIKFDSKQNLLGLNDGAKMKSWVLLTNLGGAVDAIKNDAAFRLGRMLMEPDGVYCSDGQLVHVYLNGVFKGAYLLCEQNQVNKNRVNVSEPEEGYTGTDIGYFVEIDNYSEPPFFRMTYASAAVTDVAGRSRSFRGANYSVKSDTYSQEQVDFISKYINGVFKILYEACERGNYLTFDANYDLVAAHYDNARDTAEGVIDLPSFVDMYILYELMHDYDCGEGSFYMCVDFSEDSLYPKLTLTAPWDFNWTLMGAETGIFAAAFRDESFVSSFGDRSNPWFILLYRQEWFRALVWAKWAEIGGSAGVAACINGELAILDAYAADLNRGSAAVASAKAYMSWLSRRAVWLDSIWT